MSQKKELKVLVIVPVYNELDNLRVILEDLSSVDCDRIFVNDGSSDGSGSQLRRMGERVLDLPINLGIGGCIQTGYIYALENGYDIAIQYDGDGQHLAKYIPDLVDKINEGYDYVIGSRYVDVTEGFQSTALRRIGIKVLSLIIKLISGRKFYDVTSGFRACNKAVIKQFAHYYPVDYPEPEVAGELARRGYRMSEIPVNMRERQAGISSIRPLKSLYYMIKVSLSILILSRMYKEEKK